MQRNLIVRIHKVSCIDETGGSIAERVGNDEMFLCGYAIDNNNNVTEIGPVSIYGNFDDGDVKTFYNPLVFHQFPIDNSIIQQNFAIAFILAERDMPHQEQMRKYAQDAANIARQNLKEKGMANVPGSFQQLDRWAQVSNKVGRWISNTINAMNDEFFPQVFRTSTVANDTVSDPYMEYFTVKAHDGTYKMEHDWVLV